MNGELGSTIGRAALVAEWALAGRSTGTPEVFLTGVSSPVAVALGPDQPVFVGDWASGVVYRISTTASS